MANGEISVPTQYFVISRFQPVRVATDDLVYRADSWPRAFIDDILTKLAMENTIHDVANECNCILALLPTGQKGIVPTQRIRAGDLILLHGCPRCDKEFYYNGESPRDCVSIFHDKGHTVMCPKCG